MVYPLELAVGAVLLVIGYRLHTTYPISDTSERRIGDGGTAFSTGDGEGDARRRSVVAEQAAGAALCVFGLVLVVDGLGV